MFLETTQDWDLAFAFWGNRIILVTEPASENDKRQIVKAMAAKLFEPDVNLIRMGTPPEWPESLQNCAYWLAAPATMDGEKPSGSVY